jgi:hypothetical protein
MSIQEAIPLEENHFLAQLFGTDILGRFPTAGQDRIRRTMLALIGMNIVACEFSLGVFLTFRVQGHIQHGSQHTPKHPHPPELRLF